MDKCVKVLLSTVVIGASLLAKSVIIKADMIEASNLVTQAIEQKSFYYFNIAYKEIMTIEDLEQRNYLLSSLATVNDAVWNDEIKNIMKMIDKLITTGSGKIYDDIQITISNAKIPEVDKQYLLNEVNTWGKQLVWTKDYSEAMDALLNVWSRKDSVSVIKAEVKISEVKNSYSKQYLLDELNSAKAKIDITVSFSDPNLEKVVRESINKPTQKIYSADIEKVTDLDASFRKIKSLEGIEVLINLKSINLCGNELTNIDDLKSLTKLEYLNLKRNSVEEIGALQYLNNIHHLNLSNNNIANIDILKNLANIENLDLSYNDIKDISSIKSLKKLKYLRFSFKTIADIKVLSTELPNCNITNVNSSTDSDFKIKSAYPTDGQENVVLKLGYLIIVFSHNVIGTNEYSKFILTDENKQRIDINYVQPGTTAKDNLIIRPVSTLKSNVTYNLFIPKNTIMSVDGELYDEDINIEFKMK